MSQDIDVILRDHATHGDPQSGEHEPVKSQIRQFLKTLSRMAGGNTVHVKTLAELEAITGAADDTGGFVWGDDTAENNGVYRFDAEADPNAWERIAGLPHTCAVVTDVAGTANAITANTELGVDPAEVQLLIFTPVSSNTGAATIALNSDTAVDLTDADGNDLEAGELLAGVPTFLIKSGLTWRQMFPSNLVSTAEAARDQAVAAWSDFRKRYLGAFSTPPTTDNEGNPIEDGAMYWDVNDVLMYAWNAGSWNVFDSSAVTRTKYYFTAVDGQTNFSGLDDLGKTLTYSVGAVNVIRNGSQLAEDSDFTATNGTSVILASAAGDGDAVIVEAFKSFSVADHYTKAEADAKFGGNEDLSLYDYNVIDYIRQISPTDADKVLARDKTQNATNVTLGIQNAIEATVDDLIANVDRYEGLSTGFPKGLYLVDDELMNDATLQKIYDDSSLQKRRISLLGVGSGNVIIQVASSFAGPVRNSTHGGNRTYGCWSGKPSPRSLFPLISGGWTGNALLFTLMGMTLLGQNDASIDPHAITRIKALNHRIADIKIAYFKNYPWVTMGDYNSFYSDIDIESCGFLRTQGGVLAQNSTGEMPEVDLDYTKLTSTTGEVEVSDGVTDYFNSAHVGKYFWIYNSSIVDGNVTIGRWQITTVASAKKVSITLVGTGATAANSLAATKGSFEVPTGAMSAGGNVLTLDDPILIGDNAEDMIGRMVVVSDVGSPMAAVHPNLNTDHDCLIAIITAVSGQVGSGYTELTLSGNAVRAKSGVRVVFNALTVFGYEESYLEHSNANGHSAVRHNDMNYSHCRFESKATTMIMQGNAGTVNFHDIKCHGGTLPYPNFAGEGNIIFDNVRGTDFIRLRADLQQLLE